MNVFSMIPIWWSCRESNPGPERELNGAFYMFIDRLLSGKARFVEHRCISLTRIISQYLANVGINYLSGLLIVRWKTRLRRGIFPGQLEANQSD